jgi:mono/diheme cytochrome c family protein
MKSRSISSRMIELIIGILATATVVAGVAEYALNEPERLQAAQARQLAADLDGAMTIYAENCAVCHGAAGEGIGATPALNSPALQEMDAEALTKIISRGLFGTTMPAWSLEDGGPLSEYQISQLVSQIHVGDWDATQDRVVNLGLAPLIPFVSEASPDVLEGLAELPQGEALATGITLYSQSCVACHGADGLGTSLAPALNDPAVRDQDPTALERTLRLGVSGTLMAGWEKALDDEQIAALLELMLRWDEVPSGAIPAPVEPILVTAESLALGQELYAASCASCHGPDGQGSQRAPSLNVRSYLAETPDSAMEQIITLGVPETAMQAWGDRLSAAQIQAIVGFIRSWEPTAPEIAQPVRVRGPWWQGNTSAGGSPQLPSGGAAITTEPGATAPDTTGEQIHQPPGGGAGADTGTGPGTGAGAEVGTHASAGEGAGAGTGAGQGANNPWLAQELPWYQTLDQRSIVLVVAVVLLATLMILLALRGLRQLSQKTEPIQET